MTMDQDDRARGILSATDRKWLREQTDGSTDESSHQRDSQRRKAIIERIVDSLKDFEILSEELPERLLQDVVSELRHQSTYRTGLSTGTAFLYMLANEKEYLARALVMDSEAGAHRFRTFENTLNEGIATARRQTDWYAPPQDPAVSPNGRLYELPPLELVSAEEIFSQWKEYGHWRDSETNELVYKSDSYQLTTAKAIALGNVIAGVETLQQDDEDADSRLCVREDVSHLIDFDAREQDGDSN